MQRGMSINRQPVQFGGTTTGMTTCPRVQEKDVWHPVPDKIIWNDFELRRFSAATRKANHRDVIRNLTGSRFDSVVQAPEPTKRAEV